jgi:Flp pilus assembly protein TadD
MKHGWAVVLGACIALYANSLNNGFHYDDEHSIQQNIYIRSLDNVPAFFAEPAMFSVDADKGMYRPLLLVTYALNYSFNQRWGLDGYDVRVYRVFNVLLHALCACLVWWLASLIVERREVALVAALLFALHPICTEPANYISSRSESLAALFYLLTMAFFLQGERTRRWSWKAASWGALILGLLSKSTVITVPAVLLLYDYLFIGRRDLGALSKNLLRRHMAYWLIGISYVLIIYGNKYLTRSLKRSPREGWSQFLTQSEAFVYYLKLLLWPLGLNVEHQFFAQKNLLEVSTVGAILLLLSFLFLLLYLYRKRWNLPLFLNLWGVLALLPVMVVPLNVLVNERRLYLPCVAFCLGLALVLRSAWMKRLRFAGRDAGMLLSLLVLLGYGLLSFERNQVWASDFSLWRDSVAKAPQMPRPHLYLGNAYKDAALHTIDEKGAEKHWREAKASYKRVIEVAAGPEHQDLALRALNNLGSVLFLHNEYEAAEKNYKKAVELNPSYADALVNLGNINLVWGRHAAADPGRQREFFSTGLQYFDKALAIYPNHWQAYGNRGLIYAGLGELDKARRDYERALYLNPADYSTRSNMGNLYLHQAREAQGRGESGVDLLKKARGYFQRSIQMNPAHKEGQEGLRIVERMLER